MLSNRIFGRERIDKYVKYIEKDEEARHLVKIKPEKQYEYYICDFCGSEIIIKEKKHEMTGGICIFPDAMTKRGDTKVVLCNKCLKPALKEFEEYK